MSNRLASLSLNVGTAQQAQLTFSLKGASNQYPFQEYVTLRKWGTMRTRSGFTLAETAVGMLITGLLLIFILNLFPSALFAQQAAEERIQANSLARSLLEEQVDQSFSALAVGLNRTFDPVTIGGVVHTRRFEVRQSDQASPTYLRVLLVTVDWQSRELTHRLTRTLYKHKLPHSR